MQEFEVSRFLLSLALLLSASLLIGQLFQKFGLPKVVGEVISGMLLGPSLLGHFYPALQVWIFSSFTYQSELLSVIYWLGLILLMFTSGFNFPKKIHSKNLIFISMLVVGGIVLPFLGGVLFSFSLPSNNLANPLAFYLVIGIASAVTSVPILSRIFSENKLMSSEFAIRVLSSAAILDLVLWVVLSVALNVQNNSIQTGDILQNIVKVLFSSILFTLIVLNLPTKLLYKFNFKTTSKNTESSIIGLTLLICIVVVTIAIFIRINIIFSALVAGILIGKIKTEKMEIAKINISQFSNNFFVPIYFALVGLKIDLLTSFDVTTFIQVLTVTSLFKILSVTVLIKFITNNWKQSLDYGVTMNARGGPGIVLASLAFEGKIIDENFFVIFILTSLITSLAAGIWIRNRRGSIQ
jgi:Kef-type K+ transport system membrane component KefB